MHTLRYGTRTGSVQCDEVFDPVVHAAIENASLLFPLTSRISQSPHAKNAKDSCQPIGIVFPHSGPCPCRRGRVERPPPRRARV